MIHVTQKTLVDLASLAGDDVLAGVADGIALLVRLIEASRAAPSGLVLLDCRDLVVYTASHFRESGLGFRDYCRRGETGQTAVLANLNRKSEDELTLFLRHVGDVFPACEISAQRGLVSPRLLGSLEAKQRQTMEAILRLGRADAAGLQADKPREGIGLTGWSNRLAGLAAKGLLREERDGRAKFFYPILEGLDLGR